MRLTVCLLAGLVLVAPVAAEGKKASSVLGFTMKSIDGKEVSLADKYKGKVVLFVNVASKCGLTPQYTDLQARIHALQATRNTYLTLLARASSINETLSVQQRLDDVQSQLEQLQGQVKVLDSQTDYASLEVNVRPVVGPPMISNADVTVVSPAFISTS